MSDKRRHGLQYYVEHYRRNWEESTDPLPEKVAKVVGGRAIGTFPQRPNARMNVLVLEPPAPNARPSFLVAAGHGPAPGGPVLLRFRGDPDLLLRRPPFGRFRYQVRG